MKNRSRKRRINICFLKNINKTLAEVANNYGVKVIFNNKSVVFSTNYVTDITPIVSAKLKARMEDD